MIMPRLMLVALAVPSLGGGSAVAQSLSHDAPGGGRNPTPNNK
jgi:hypothetical protein